MGLSGRRACSCANPGRALHRFTLLRAVTDADACRASRWACVPTRTICLKAVASSAQLQGEPLDLFAVDEEPEEYRRVFVEGTFDHAASQVGRGGQGASWVGEVLGRGGEMHAAVLV